MLALRIRPTAALTRFLTALLAVWLGVGCTTNTRMGTIQKHNFDYAQQLVRQLGDVNYDKLHDVIRNRAECLVFGREFAWLESFTQSHDAAFASVSVQRSPYGDKTEIDSVTMLFTPKCNPAWSNNYFAAHTATQISDARTRREVMLGAVEAILGSQQAQITEYKVPGGLRAYSFEKQEWHSGARQAFPATYIVASHGEHLVLIRSYYPRSEDFVQKIPSVVAHVATQYETNIKQYEEASREKGPCDDLTGDAWQACNEQQLAELRASIARHEEQQRYERWRSQLGMPTGGYGKFCQTYYGNPSGGVQTNTTFCR